MTTSSISDIFSSKHGSRANKEQRVAIIGAGVAGCATAAALNEYNIDFVVYDKHPKAGSLWADNYPGPKVQSRFDLYGYPCKNSSEEIHNQKDPPAPAGSEVCDKVDEFIREKGIKNKFNFNTRIEDIQSMSENEWIIKFADGSTKSFSFVIICTGIVYKPKMIDISGKDVFKCNGGQIVHSSERRDEIMFKDQKVMVIGNGKSAVDAATIAARIAKENGTKAPIQVAGHAPWYIPRFVHGLSQYKDEEHLEKLRTGEVDMRIAKINSLEPCKAILSNGQEEEVDVIVMATGWTLGFDTLMDKCSIMTDVEVEEDGLWLYRNILPANMKGLAFIGSNTLTFKNIYTSYIQAYWLASLLAKERPWPKKQDMQRAIQQDKAFKRKLYPFHVLRAASVEACLQHYHNILFQDMDPRKPFSQPSKNSTLPMQNTSSPMYTRTRARAA